MHTYSSITMGIIPEMRKLRNGSNNIILHSIIII